MLKKIRNVVLLVMAVLFTSVGTAGATGTEGIDTVTPAEVFNRLRNVVDDVLTPLGGFLIFLSVVFVAFKLITTANKPQERADALASLPYIAGGGILLGAALLLTGFILGLMGQF